MTVHTYPTNDHYPHSTNGTPCACKPRIVHVDGGIVIVHNSFDGREILENCEVTKN